MGLLEISRKEEFAPIKNNDNDLTDNPKSAL